MKMDAEKDEERSNFFFYIHKLTSYILGFCCCFVFVVFFNTHIENIH